MPGTKVTRPRLQRTEITGYLYFYGDSDILSAVYLLVLMDLNLDKLKLKFTRCYHFLIHDTNTLVIQIISLKILPKFTK